MNTFLRMVEVLRQRNRENLESIKMLKAFFSFRLLTTETASSSNEIRKRKITFHLNR